VGSRFRCHCGDVVKIQEPKRHDAAVVRCSSCGAPREEGSTACRFCGADFTLHERDLHTVCPGCFTRVSDSGRFCHHCGLRLAPELIAGDATPLVCPACSESCRLANRRIGDYSAMECGQCAGLWLGNETFQRLSERAESEVLDLDRLFDAPHAQPSRRGATDQNEPDGWRYRKCPDCGKIMHRRNYAGSSGVIVDFCREHGVWFDADELPRILAWIRSGGLAKAKEEQARKAAQEARWKQLSPDSTELGVVMGVPLGHSDGSWGESLFDDFFDGIVSLFRRTR
jgi:Zn-finger nucleic acid-binding protein